MYNIVLRLYAKGMFPWDWIFQKGSLNMHLVWYKMIKYAHGYKYEKNELHVLSLQRKRNEKRGKCIFTAVYSYM